MSTPPSSLAWRSVSAQLAWPAARRPSTATRPSAPASGARPWSCSIRSARKASSAQYWRNRFTGLPRAAAPAVRTAAACSLSSVPEKSTTFSGSPMSSPRRRKDHGAGLAGRHRGHASESCQAPLEDLAHHPARDHHVGVAKPIADLTTVPFSVDDARGAEDGEVLRDVRLARADMGGQTSDLDRTVRECVKDLEPSRVGEGLQDLGLQDRDLIHVSDY